MTSLLAYIAISLIGVVIMMELMDNAPEGYEDEHGFHFGYPPRIEN